MTVLSEIGPMLVDPKAYADGSIYEAYRWLRRNDPLASIEVEGYQPFRVVTLYSDVQYVSRHNALFHSSPNPTLSPISRMKLVRELTGSTSPIKSLVDMDPPEHGKYRALTSPWFQPGNLKSLEGRIRDIAREMVERMVDARCQCDFARLVAHEFPLQVILEILGLPREDHPVMLRLTQEMFGATDPDVLGNRSATNDSASASDLGAVREMMAYFDKLTEDRRAHPTSDLASVIANARIDGEPMGHLETMGYYVITATAGHDTTSSSIGGAMWALAEHPDQFARLKADMSLLPTMIDEAIRWTTPVKHFMRTATADTEIGGRPVREGERLMLCYGSANRDESVFDDPDTFRLDRKPNRHLAFGYGGHLCLGQYLARIEMRILFEELLPRLSSLALDGEPAMTEAIFVSGPKRLPIRYEIAPPVGAPRVADAEPNCPA
ncbi:cytochrome P450 [Novosphingobium pentaromativorans]|uniref:Cytochrome P450-terp n=1 Tax=Novosphingobium pentaromativorans US6-1 TaxID=1088721 RepID=G6ED38_9SPHN|nr:cytochrome P450 [Novosphingobium pentaromativorans]AIT79859.1 cytochrome P450 [Novosphingobium pentaromativorans US6-1]EHJ60750.1 Cytochrome P450-terp [Novosphingobium pentaromativorans US6-1]